jgi:hypothetical protein
MHVVIAHDTTPRRSIFTKREIYVEQTGKPDRCEVSMRENTLEEGGRYRPEGKSSFVAVEKCQTRPKIVKTYKRRERDTHTALWYTTERARHEQ